MPFSNGVYSLPFRIGTNTPTEPQFSGQVGADFDDLEGIINGSPFLDVKNFGAVGNGSTDDTAAVQAAVDEAVNSGDILVFTAGNYLVSSDIVSNGPIAIQGSRGATITVGNNDCVAFMLESGAFDSVIRDMAFLGSQDFGAAHPTLWLKPGSNNAQIENCSFQGGRYGILNQSTDNLFFNNVVRTSFGSALVKSNLGGGGNWVRNKTDQQWPMGQPPDNYTINAWAPTTAYAAGDVVSTSGWNIQCMVGGTSGSVAPTLLGYETDIHDGADTLVWHIAMPTTFYSFQMDSGAQENILRQNDHSGAFTSSVGMTDTGDDGAGSPPFFLVVDEDTCGAHMKAAIDLLAGSKAIVTHCEIGVGIGSADAVGIGTSTGWTGNLHITDNKFAGGNSSGVGVALYGGCTQIIITDNIMDGTINHFINVDTGGGAITDFTISNNITDGNDIVIAVGSDWYIVTDNNTRGAGVVDNGGAVTKVVTGNI